MSLTEINKSDLTPHLRCFLDDLISMTSGIVIKQNNIASSYEDPTSATLFEYYKAILNGDDTLAIYNEIPYEVYASILAWNEVGEEASDSFPDYIEYGAVEIPMKNKMNKCYVGSTVPDNDFGEKYDGFILIEEASMDEIVFLKEIYDKDDPEILTGYEPIENISDIDFEKDYCLIDDSIISIQDVKYRYIKKDDTYVLDDKGIYLYNVEYTRYFKSELFDYYQITEMMDSKSIPSDYRDRVLTAMREYVINTYVDPDKSPKEDFTVKRYFGEKNTYYRMLNGLPASNRMTSEPRIDRLLINPTYRGTDKNPYLYNLTDDEVNIIKKNGMYDKLLETHQSINYLRYMGDNRVDVVEARSADNFDIVRIGDYDNKIHYDIFISNYQIAKEYVMKKFYYPELFSKYEYYGNYISFQIVCQALMQCIARSDTILLNYLYSDENTVKLRLESYGLNVFNEIPLIYRRNIAKYIEILIKNKGTDAIYSTIINLFGTDNIEVYKYFYRRVKDADGQIQLSMAQVPIETKKFINDMIKDVNKVDYDEVTTSDIYWGSYGMPTGSDPDEYLKDIITNKTSFNYANSKYISINSIFNLSKLNFNSSYLMNYLLELSQRNQNLKVPVDILGGRESLFMVLVLLFACMAKRLRYDGNIQHDAISVAYVLKYNLYDYIMKDGEKIKIIDFYKKYYRDYYYKYMNENNLTPNDANKLVTLTIPTDISLASISETYLKNSGLDGIYNRIINEREKASTYKEYECYNELLKAISISKMNSNIFSLKKPEWIEIDNFVAWVKVTDEDTIRKVIDDYNNDTEIDYILCKSHGYPDLSLGYDYSEDKTQYCIDISSKNDDVYVKEYIVSGDMNNDRIIGYDSIVYSGTKDVYDANISSTYDNYYYYNKDTDKLYKYLKYARTYEEYLKYTDITLYNLLQPTSDDYEKDQSGDVILNSNGKPVLNELYYNRINELYVSLLVDIENVIKNNELKNIFNNSSVDSGLLSTYIKKVINVFKSFEVDIAAINIVYEMDDRSNHRAKFVDELSAYSEETHFDHFHLVNVLNIDEESTIESEITIRDELNIEEN